MLRLKRSIERRWRWRQAKALIVVGSLSTNGFVRLVKWRLVWLWLCGILFLPRLLRPYLGLFGDP